MENLIEKLKLYGIGHRKLDDDLFANDRPPSRLGVYDVDDEDLCHNIVPSTCNVPGCQFASDSLLEYESHYNSVHRYVCSQCKKVLPSAHLLDLHVQETHDSFFLVMAERRPSYCCYIEECKQKFQTPDERFDHCVKHHRLPKNFRFDHRPNHKAKTKKNTDSAMDIEVTDANEKTEERKFFFNNNKQKGFVKYKGKMFTNDKNMQNDQNTDVEITVSDLRDSLPR